MIERKKFDITNKIRVAYDGYVNKTFLYKEGLTALSETIEKVKNPEVKLDLEWFHINKSISLRISELSEDVDLQM